MRGMVRVTQRNRITYAGVFWIGENGDGSVGGRVGLEVDQSMVGWMS